MRGLGLLALVAVVAHRLGRREGRNEGVIVGVTKASAAYAAGIIKGDS